MVNINDTATHPLDIDIEQHFAACIRLARQFSSINEDTLAGLYVEKCRELGCHFEVYADRKSR